MLFIVSLWKVVRGRAWRCSCNIFLVTGEPPPSSSISADPPSNRCPHRTHASTSWAKLNLRAVVLAQAIEATLTEPKKCQVKIRDRTSCSSVASLCYALFYTFWSAKRPSLQLSVAKPCHRLLRKQCCPYSSKTRGTVLFHVYSHFYGNMKLIWSKYKYFCAVLM